MTATSIAARRSTVPEWVLCPACRTVVYGERLARDLYVCHSCGHHHRVGAATRIAQLFDEGAESYGPHGRSADALGFADSAPYPERLERARVATGLDEGVLLAEGTIDGHPLVAAVMDFAFMGGSLGTAVGAAVVQAADRALERRVPLLLVCASGGARMQEGPLALMQMATTTQALRRLDEAGILTISLITDPTYGGVAASYATQCDVVIAEPEARLGFAGPRVIEQTIKQHLPPDFQSAESLQTNGLLDTITPRRTLRATLSRLLPTSPPPPAHERGDGDDATHDGTRSAPHGAAPGAVHDATPGAVHDATPGAVHDATPGAVRDTPRVPDRGAGGAVIRDAGELVDGDAWRVVRGARDLGRPTALDCVGWVCDGFQELRGDRVSGDCPAVVGGVARIDGMAVVVIGHQKGHTLAELAGRNYGMATPQGYRKAARLMRLAGKLGLPVVTFVDTPGAYPGVEAERDGQAIAIAESIRVMSGLPVPVVSVVIGEGGSGGALALGVADEVLMLSGATYSVISPEGCASILWHDRGRAAEAAEALHLTAPRLLRLGVVDGVIPEPDGGAAADPATTAHRVGAALTAALHRLTSLPKHELPDRRAARFRTFTADEEPR